MHARSIRISRPEAPTLCLHESGAGEPTFLLIHGFGDGGYIWQEFLPQLTSLGRTIAVDLRGHGDSDWDAYSLYSTEAHLHDIEFVINTLGLRKLVLIGHSLGGEIAIRLAARHTERVSGVVVVDFGPELNRDATAHIRREFVAESRIYSGYPEYAAHLEAKQPLVSSSICESLAKSALRSRAHGGYELKRDPKMGVTEFNTPALPALWPMLQDIICPALVVRGAASSVLRPSVAKRMAGVLPNGSFASVSSAGHAVMIDNPEVFAETAISFITGKVISGSIGEFENHRSATDS